MDMGLRTVCRISFCKRVVLERLEDDSLLYALPTLAVADPFQLDSRICTVH